MQFIKYTRYNQVGIDCLDLNHTKDKDVFVKHKCLCQQQRSTIVYFKYKCQGHKAIDPGVIERNSLSTGMHAKYEVSISYGSKVTWPRLNISDMLVKGQGN